MYKANVNQEVAKEVKFDESGKGYVDGKLLKLDTLQTGGDSLHVLLDNKNYSVEIIELDRQKKTAHLRINGNDYHVGIKDHFDELLSQMGMERGASAQEKNVKAPMPGMVLKILVEPGQAVEKDQAILILEAMKMENVLKSPREGEIAIIHAIKGVAVEKNEVLIDFV